MIARSPDNAVGPLIGSPQARPVRPGESIVLVASGLGPTDPLFDPSRPFIAPLPLARLDGVNVALGENRCSVKAADANEFGNFRVLIEVPSDLPDGIYPLKLTVEGKSTQPDLYLMVEAEKP